jgi:hypothetical protein
MILVLPFKGLYILSQEFGVNPDNYKQFLVQWPDGTLKPLGGHDGLDFACPYRTEIIAPHNGSILEATNDPAGYGNYIKVENEQMGSVLAHLDTIDVPVGASVNQGDHLGWSDSTGNSTGNHLHWGFYTKPRDRANGFGGFIDQTPLLLQSGITVKLGELPVIANQTVLSETDKMYKGIDLTNTASVKAAIDSWQDVANGNYVTKDTYDTLQKSNDLLTAELLQTKEANTELVKNDADYANLKAAGYNTLSDVQKVIDQNQSETLGVKKQLVNVLQDNTQLHTMLGNKDQSDYSAILNGMDAVVQNKDLRGMITDITKAVEVEKPILGDIIAKILTYKDAFNKVIAQAEQNHQVPGVQVVAYPSKLSIYLDNFVRFLKFPQDSKEVK